MNKLKSLIIAALVILVALPLAFLTWVYSATYHPDTQEMAELTCPAQAPIFDANQPLSILSYNVQFFAGKNSIFYFDMPDNAGPDIRPSRTDIDATLDGIAEKLMQENPDVVLLQEVHDGATATDERNQLDELLNRLPNGMYPCYSEAFYWKADFVPHPKIMGSVGMKLVTLSKYQLANPIRHRLPQPPMDWVSAQFYLKRAILDTELVTQDGENIHLLNTHFDAFAQGSDTMEQQVGIAQSLLETLDKQNTPWVFTGDLNLLLPNQRSTLDDSQHYLYAEQTELTPLLTWQHFPNVELLSNENTQQWMTHLPNDPDVATPDRVIDYVFHSSHWQAQKQRVLNTGDWLTLSDHFPVTSTLILSKKSN